MPDPEIVLDPADFVTVGTLGPKGRRVFYLQAGKDTEVVSLIIEKQQAQALSEAINEILDDLDRRLPGLTETEANRSGLDMSLRHPVEDLFRVAQMGLGYDEDRDLIVLVAQELVANDESLPAFQPQIVRVWCTREQMRVLSDRAGNIVSKGRADPGANGFMIYYWT
ncbi:MAG: DUF3090 domain-containing protein [Anaerolineae bacterium]|nr:DUF3090 domain-containing protein [Anaerolineae bacterium]